MPLLDTKLLKNAGIFAFVSAETVTYVLVGFWLGQFLDKKIGFKSVCTGGLSLIGLIYGVWRVYLKVRALLEKDN